MEINEMISAVKENKVLYGVEKKNLKIRRCKIDKISFENGKETQDCQLSLVGKHQPKHVGEMVIFATRKEAVAYAAKESFVRLIEHSDLNVVDAESFIVEDTKGRQWRPVVGTNELICLSFDGIGLLSLSNIPGMVWCPADWTTAYMPGDSLTYKWSPNGNS